MSIGRRRNGDGVLSGLWGTSRSGLETTGVGFPDCVGNLLANSQRHDLKRFGCMSVALSVAFGKPRQRYDRVNR